MSGEPAIAAVVCCYAEERYADVCFSIESLLDQTIRDVELVVVVDHNETLLARLTAVFPQVRVYANAGRRGLSGARNTGIAVTRASIVAFLDDDARADPAMLGIMAEVFADPAVLGVVASITPAWSGIAPSWFPPEFLWVVGCTYRGMDPGPVRNLIGAAMALRRNIFLRVGPFDEGTGRTQAGLPLGCEETELCIRAGRAFPQGHFVYEPRAGCQHRVGKDRVTLRYFVRRCWAEGISKARLAGLGVVASSLSTERTYVSSTLPQGILRGLGETFRDGDRSGLKRATMIEAGLGVTTAGYLFGRALGNRAGRVSR